MPNSGFDVGEIDSLLQRARKNGKAYPFAFGLGGAPKECALVVHLRKPPKALVTALKQTDAKVKKICFGTFTVEGKLVLFMPNRPVKGLVRQLRRRFRDEGLLKFRPVLVDEDGVEIDEELLPDEDPTAELEPAFDEAEPEVEPEAELSEADQDLRQRLAKARPRVMALEGAAQSRMADLMKTAVETLAAKQLEAAEGHVSLLERGLNALKTTPPQQEDTESGDPLKIWRDAKELADVGVSDLQSALRGIDHPDLKRIAEMGLNGVTDGNQVALSKALFEYNAAQGPARARSAAKLKAQVEAYRSFIESSAIIQLCENNPFGVKVAIGAPLNAALDRIERAIAA